MSHLQSCPLFRSLSDEEFGEVMAAVKVRDLADGDLLFRQGDPSEHVYIVRRGNIRIYAVEDGVEETYTTLSLGAVFGEIGVLKSQPRSAFAVAEGEASLFVFAGAAFEEMVARFPGVARIVHQTMFGRFRNDLRRAEDREKARAETALFPVFSGSGGAGTSLVTANLAAAVRELTGKTVLVVDLDLMFGDQGALFGLEGTASLVDLAMEQDLEAGDVLRLVQPTRAGVDVLAAPPRPEHAEFCSPEFIGACLDRLAGRYDFVFCDTSCHLDVLALDLFDRAHCPLYVLTPELTSIRHAARWMDVVGRIGLPVERLKVLMNRVGESDETSLEYVRKRFEGKLLDHLPADPKAAKLSLNRGEVLGAAAPKSPLTAALRRAAGKLVGIEVEAAPASFFRGWI